MLRFWLNMNSVLFQKSDNKKQEMAPWKKFNNNVEKQIEILKLKLYFGLSFGVCLVYQTQIYDSKSCLF